MTKLMGRIWDCHFVFARKVKPGDAVDEKPLGGDGVVRMSTGQEEGQ